MRCLPFRTPSPPGRCGLSPEAGLRVPGDIAVIGFDGTELAEVVSPQLTTVEQPSRAIGRTAVSLLMKRIDDPDAAVERVMMDWRVIDRASV